jgi:polyisoprenoid-binding protein YceI
MLRCLFAAALVAALSVPASAADITFPLNGENTKITFVGKKPDGKHEGGFKTLTGTATVTDGKVETLKAEIEIDMNSIYSDSDKLTGHLKNSDFFDVQKYPKATFKVTKVEKADKVYTVTGELTMHGKTEPLSFPASIATDATGLSVSTSFPLDRTKWGMNYEKGVEKIVPLTITVTAKPKK